MSLFSYSHYRQYLRDYLKTRPNRGHGELAKIAKALGVHSTLMSLVLSGERELTLEQGYDLSKYLDLTAIETEYFSLLIQHERAGNVRYKSFVKQKLEKLQLEATQVARRFDHEKQLTDEKKAIFYSSWLYSAIRLYASTDTHGKSPEQIHNYFDLPRSKVLMILEFLEGAGLVVQNKGRYLMGPQRTFLAHGSPYLVKHHANWRIKALQRADFITDKELMFTSPISLSKGDFEKIRERLLGFLKEFSTVVKDSPAEEVACLNLDFFYVRGKGSTNPIEE